MKKTTLPLCILCLCGVMVRPAQSAELYLPTTYNPAMDARIEKLFVQAGMPVIKRPIAVTQVQQALNKIGTTDPALTASIERYLQRFDRNAGVSRAGLSLATSSGAEHPLANQRGVTSASNYSIAVAGFWKLGEWLTVNAGGVTYDGTNGRKDEFAEGSFISLGNNYVQLDLGNRPHWFGPFQESDMLQSANASATPGVTLSNVTPLTRLGIRYELFLTEMSKSEQILSEDRSERLTGNPRLFGFHLSFEPVDGFALGFNRLMQYGGADRDDSLKSLAEAFFDAKSKDNIGQDGNDFGNQITSITTRFSFAGEKPLSIYMEYAGEDTSQTSNAHLGNTSLMVGLHAPRLTATLDATYEFAEWQNGWYVNTNYGDGMRQHGSVMGHWGANNRIFSDAVGASTHLAKLNWYISADKTLITKYRQVSNKDYSATAYETGYEMETEYNQQFKRFSAGLSLQTGSDVFGDSYSQLSGIIRW